VSNLLRSFFALLASIRLRSTRSLLDERGGRVAARHDELNQTDTVRDVECRVAEEGVELSLRADDNRLVWNCRARASKEREEELVVV
jgi:hypothetical protein